jgi:hypothetical protein
MSWPLIVFCLLLNAQPAPVVRLYPVDDSPRDSAFRSYVGKLRAAVEDRSASALRRLVDEEVVVGPGEDDKGWAKFTARWRPEDLGNSGLWTALSDLLALGFIRAHPNLFLSPYLVWRFPPELNMAKHLVVIRDNAALRESPSLSAPVVASLSFEIVQQLENARGGDQLIQWVRVRTLGGQTGYLNAREALSPLMPRAQFAKRRGRWTLIALEGPNQ